MDNFNGTFQDIFNSYVPENGNSFVIKRPDETIFHVTNSQN